MGAQRRWARVAISPARRTSSGAAEPTTVRTSSVALSRTSIAPPAPVVHPPEKIRPSQLAASSTFVIACPSCHRGLLPVCGDELAPPDRCGDRYTEFYSAFSLPTGQVCQVLIAITQKA